jgi:glutaredoxin 3
MSQKRQIEVFSAGCPVCEEAIEIVKRIACSSCEVHVVDMHDQAVASKAASYGINRVPSVVVDGSLPTAAEAVALMKECCGNSGSAHHCKLNRE